MVNYRTIKYYLTDITSLNKEDHSKIISFYDSYTLLFKQLCEKINIEDIIEWEEISSKGKFRDRFIKEYGKIQSSWNIQGNKAKYYRMMIGTLRQYALSLTEKNKISQICESYNYDISQLSDIRKTLINNNLYPTNSLIRNICRSKKLPNKEKEITPIIDFTHEDNQVSKIEYSGTIITYSLKIYNEWVSFTINIPLSNIRDFTGVFSRAIIQKENNTGKLYLRMTYEPAVQDHVINTDLSLGVDQGKIKPVSCAITSRDGSYSTELVYTKEVNNIAHKHDILQSEKELLYGKRSGIEALMTGLDTDSVDYFDLLLSLGGVQEQIDFLRAKQSRLKNHMGWVISRDVVNHALHFNVGVIKLENLSVFENTGKWNHRIILQRIREVAELHNIKVEIVNSKNSSHVDPFTNNMVSPDNKRMMRTAIGLRDRDYVAALEISRRPGKSVNKKKRRKKSKTVGKTSLVVGRSRDKHAPTPKRPKQKSRKKKWKEFVKGMNDLKEVKSFSDNSRSGHSIAVSVLGVDSYSDCNTTVSLDRDFNGNNHMYDVYTIS